MAGRRAGVVGSDRFVDATRLRAIARGDEHALAALYDAHAAALLAIAQRILRDRNDAEDLVHDLFVEVWHRASAYDASRGSVRSWLLVRLRSRAIDRLRSQATRRRLLTERVDGATATADSTSAEEVVAQGQEKRTVSVALEALTPRQREAVELAYFQGLTAAEIAARIDVPTGTVKSRLASALAALRRVLHDASGPEEGAKASASQEMRP